MTRRILATLALVALWEIVSSGGTRCAWGMEKITFRHQDQTLQAEGKVLVEDRQGGVLLLGRDGRMWTIGADELLRRETTPEPFTPFSKEELGKRLLAELGSEFRLYSTKHYLICYNTSDAFARWTGAMFERLYRAFHTFWDRKRFKLHEPEFPLVALVFADRASFERYAREPLGDAAKEVIGFYNQRTNRMVLVDLTGVAPQRRRYMTSREIRLLLSRPGAERTVATVIHEATHQIAYNTGLQRRFSDVPLWVSEGLAMYFEVPDLKSTRGWRGLGKVNPVRARGFLQYLPKRPADSLVQLMKDDKRFRDPQQMHHAYDEAWAWYFFLMKTRPRQMVQYHQLLAKKPILRWDTPQQRLEEFTGIFGPLPPLEKAFFRFLKSLR